MQPQPKRLLARIPTLHLRRPSWRAVLLTVGVLTTLLAGMAALRREQITFTARCWGNGNALPACACVYNALDDLPGNYRALAVSWAHEKGTAFAAGVMRLVAAETWRVTSARLERLVSIGDRKQAIETWIWKTADAIGWMALKEVAPTVASGLAPVIASLPFVDDVVGELARADIAIGRHCSTQPTFLTRIYQTREAAADRLEALTSVTLEAAKATGGTVGKSTTATTVATTVRVWTWVRSWF
jgi:hypothetical protein